MPADTDRLEVYEAADGWRWRRVAGNNRVIVPPEQHTREEDAWRAAYRACPDLDPSYTLTPLPDPALASATLAAAAALLDSLADPDTDSGPARDHLTGLLGG